MQSFQNKSESEITGDAYAAGEALRTALGAYIAATSGAGLIKQRGTTLSISLCDECHPAWEAAKNGEYKTWKLRQLGKAGYEALERKARFHH
jgi:hypothetical protein